MFPVVAVLVAIAISHEAQNLTTRYITSIAISLGSWCGRRARFGKEVLRNRYCLERGGLLNGVRACMMFSVRSILACCF